MKSQILAISSIIGMALPAFAAGGDTGTGASLLVILFLGFAAIVVVFQFIPGLVLLFSMLKGLFSAAPTDASASHGRK